MAEERTPIFDELATRLPGIDPNQRNGAGHDANAPRPVTPDEDTSPDSSDTKPNATTP